MISTIFLINFKTIFILSFLLIQINAGVLQSLEKDCDKIDDDLEDDGQKETDPDLKTYKGSVEHLLDDILAAAQKIENDAEKIQREFLRSEQDTSKSVSESPLFVKPKAKDSRIDKITPHLHGFLMVTPDKHEIPTKKTEGHRSQNNQQHKYEEENKNEVEQRPNVYEVLNIFLRYLNESCKNHPVEDKEKLLNVLARLKRSLNNEALQ